MQKQKKQPKIIFLFSFGSHGTAKDFEKAKDAAEKFKPHVYASETVNLTNRERQETTLEINELYAEARTNRFLRDIIISKTCSSHFFAGFFVSEIEYIINSSIIYYPLETHDIPVKYIDIDFSGPIFQALQRGDIALAEKLELVRLKTNALENFRREQDIVQNISTYFSELLSHFPSLEKQVPIRVFVRLGELHRSVYVAALKKYATNLDIKITRTMDNPKTEFLPLHWIMAAIAFGTPIHADWPLRSLFYQTIQFCKDALKICKTIKYEQIAAIFARAASYTSNPILWQDQVEKLASKALE